MLYNGLEREPRRHGSMGQDVTGIFEILKRLSSGGELVEKASRLPPNDVLFEKYSRYYSDS